jgi:hypothetical protein
MDEKGSNTCRIVLWIKLGILLLSPTIASIKGFAPAPASAANNLSALLDDKIRAVSNELFINPKYRSQGCLYLCQRIIRRLQGTHG